MRSLPIRKDWDWAYRVARIWLLVEKTEHHWYWRGYFNPKRNLGDIGVCYMSKTLGHREAHRVIWCLTYGKESIAGKVMHNYCGDRFCVRPHPLHWWISGTAKLETPINHPIPEKEIEIELTDSELELKLMNKFKEKGWDK